jgi:hypothetical protein
MVKKFIYKPTVLVKPKKQLNICLNYSYKELPIIDKNKSQCILYDYSFDTQFKQSDSKLIYSRDNISIYIKYQTNLNNYKLIPKCLFKQKKIS